MTGKRLRTFCCEIYGGFFTTMLFPFVIRWFYKRGWKQKIAGWIIEQAGYVFHPLVYEKYNK